MNTSVTRSLSIIASRSRSLMWRSQARCILELCADFSKLGGAVESLLIGHKYSLLTLRRCRQDNLSCTGRSSDAFELKRTAVLGRSSTLSKPVVFFFETCLLL